MEAARTNGGIGSTDDFCLSIGVATIGVGKVLEDAGQRAGAGADDCGARDHGATYLVASGGRACPVTTGRRSCDALECGRVSTITQWRGPDHDGFGGATVRPTLFALFISVAV